jgi:O-antigen/teichoic acid export membrane protein
MRSSVMAAQFVWRPFDAFSPRWQIAYCKGANGRVADEFGLMTRVTLLLAFVAACGVMFFNRPFVVLWTKPEFFGGMELTIFAGIVLVLQSISRCYAAPFILSMKLRSYIWVTVGSILVGTTLMCMLSKSLGISGIPLGIIAAELIFPLWFYISKGGGILLEHAFSPVFKDLFYWLPSLILSGAGASLLTSHQPLDAGQNLLLCASLWLAFSLPALLRIQHLLCKLTSHKDELTVVNGQPTSTTESA